MTYNLGDWGKHPDDPDEAARYQAAVATVRNHRPELLFAQELFVPAGEQAQAVATRFVRAAGLDAAVAAEGNHAQLASCIGWRHPVTMRPGSARRATPERFWHALHGVTLTVDRRDLDCWVYHGPPRGFHTATGLRPDHVRFCRDRTGPAGKTPIVLDQLWDRDGPLVVIDDRAEILVDVHTTARERGLYTPGIHLFAFRPNEDELDRYAPGRAGLHIVNTAHQLLTEALTTLRQQQPRQASGNLTHMEPTPPQ
jgi:hypothetical protein